MLEKLPKGVGRALHEVRAGAADLAIAHTELTGVNAIIEISSRPLAPIDGAICAGGSRALSCHQAPDGRRAADFLVFRLPDREELSATCRIEPLPAPNG